MPLPAPSARRPVRILVVEDEALVAADLESRLSGLGYEVAGLADTATDAVEMTRRLLPDVVLMDIHLIGSGDGISAADRIRLSPGTPVVFATAHADNSTVERAGHAEPFGYVIKPFENRDLRVAIEMALYRHRAESRLRKMEQWVTSTLASLGDALIATEAEGQVRFINDAACELTGWSALEAFGRPVEDIFRVIDASGSVIETRGLIAQTLTDGIGLYFEGEHRLLRRDGSTLALEDSIAPIRTDSGTFDGGVIVFRDASQRRSREEARLEMEHRVQRAQRVESIATLAGGIATEFQQYLSRIRGNLDLARKEIPRTSLALPLLAAAESAAGNALTACDQLLTLAGRAEQKIGLVNLTEIVADCLLLLRRRVRSGVRFETALSQNLPPFPADAGQLQRLVTSLVTNACEAAPDPGGAVSLTTACFRADRAYLEHCQVGADNPEGEYLALEVTDNGAGMSPEIVSRLLDPFYTTKSESRGLGLSLVAGILRQHRGALFVDSIPGSGSRFRVLFPRGES